MEPSPAQRRRDPRPLVGTLRRSTARIPSRNRPNPPTRPSPRPRPASAWHVPRSRPRGRRTVRHTRARRRPSRARGFPKPWEVLPAARRMRQPSRTNTRSPSTPATKLIFGAMRSAMELWRAAPTPRRARQTWRPRGSARRPNSPRTISNFAPSTPNGRFSTTQSRRIVKAWVKPPRSTAPASTPMKMSPVRKTQLNTAIAQATDLGDCPVCL